MLDSTRYHCNVSRFNCSLLGPNPEANRAFNHPNKLLMRVLVHGNMRVRLHSPIDHRALFAEMTRRPILSVTCSSGTDASLSNPAITDMPFSSFFVCAPTISQKSPIDLFARKVERHF